MIIQLITFFNLFCYTSYRKMNQPNSSRSSLFSSKSKKHENKTNTEIKLPNFCKIFRKMEQNTQNLFFSLFLTQNPQLRALDPCNADKLLSNKMILDFLTDLLNKYNILIKENKVGFNSFIKYCLLDYIFLSADLEEKRVTDFIYFYELINLVFNITDYITNLKICDYESLVQEYLNSIFRLVFHIIRQSEQFLNNSTWFFDKNKDEHTTCIMTMMLNTSYLVDCFINGDFIISDEVSFYYANNEHTLKNDHKKAQNFYLILCFLYANTFLNFNISKKDNLTDQNKKEKQIFILKTKLILYFFDFKYKTKENCGINGFYEIFKLFVEVSSIQDTNQKNIKESVLKELNNIDLLSIESSMIADLYKNFYSKLSQTLRRHDPLNINEPNNLVPCLHHRS